MYIFLIDLNMCRLVASYGLIRETSKHKTTVYILLTSVPSQFLSAWFNGRIIFAFLKCELIYGVRYALCHHSIVVAEPPTTRAREDWLVYVATITICEEHFIFLVRNSVILVGVLSSGVQTWTQSVFAQRVCT